MYSVKLNKHIFIGSAFFLLFERNQLGQWGAVKENRQLSKMPRRAKKWKRNEEKEKGEAVQLESLMAWVMQRISVAGHVPRLIDVIEQGYKGFGFSALTCRTLLAALRRHPYYHLSLNQTKVARQRGSYWPIVCN